MKSFFLLRVTCFLPPDTASAAGLTQIEGDRHALLLEGCLVYPNSPTFDYHS